MCRRPAPHPPSGAETDPAAGQGDDRRQICFDFTKGVCSRGASCKYSHSVEHIIAVNSEEKGICFDFLKGLCNRGLMCRFSHDLSNLQPPQVSDIASVPLVRRRPHLAWGLTHPAPLRRHAAGPPRCDSLCGHMIWPRTLTV